MSIDTNWGPFDNQGGIGIKWEGWLAAALDLGLVWIGVHPNDKFPVAWGEIFTLFNTIASFSLSPACPLRYTSALGSFGINTYIEALIIVLDGT